MNYYLNISSIYTCILILNVTDITANVDPPASAAPMVICVGGRGSGKTLILNLLRNKDFDTDSLLVPTVGVNIFRVEVNNHLIF